MVAPAVIAAAATVGAALLQSYMAKKQGEQDRAWQEEQAEKQRKASALQNAQNNMISITGQAGDREQNALQNLIGVFQRTAR